MNEKIYNNISSPFDSAVSLLDTQLQRALFAIPQSIKAKVQEIRLRANKQLVLYCGEESYFVAKNSSVSKQNVRDNICVEYNKLKQIFDHLCNYSIYSYQNELKNGFITVKGGHRVGICATALYCENKLSGIRDVSSINVRIAREVQSCADDLIKNISLSEGGIIIFGKPSSGKTTIIRDFARQLSLKMKKVCVIDERGELAAQFEGVSQNDLGLCDVLNGYKKSEGMMLALRSLSPEIIICDEISGTNEAKAIQECLNSGVTLCSTIHAGSLEEFLCKEQAVSLLHSNAFSNVIQLNEESSSLGKIKKTYKVSELYDKSSRVNSDSSFSCRGGLFAS